MKITNVNNLPIQFINAVNTDYKPTPYQYSVTTVLNPTRATILQRRYNDILEDDVSNQIWAILGSAFHLLLENSKEEDHELKEEYLRQELSCLDEQLKGYHLSGKSDLYNSKEEKIIDFKTTSAFKFLLKDFEDYRMQLLMYAWLFKKIGFNVKQGEIIAILRDWQKSKAKIDKDYPQLQVQTLSFDFTEKDYDEIEKYIINKFLELKHCEELPDEELPMCTLEERWNSGDSYIVIKKGNKRATKIHDTLESAQEHLNNLEKEYTNLYEIQERKGEDKKCLEYCSCCEYCDYYKKNYAKEGE